MMLIEQFQNEQFLWVAINNSNTKGLKNLQHKYHLTDEVLTYALDENERARVEYDPLEGHFLLVVNVPEHTKTQNHHETSPMTFIIKEHTFITIYNDQTASIVTKMHHAFSVNFKNETPFSFLFHSLFLISDSYFPLIEQVNDKREELNSKLREKTTNKHLLELSDLEIGLVYFVSATKQNAVLLEQLKALDLYKKLSNQEKEQLEDAAIEAKQAVEMIQLSSQIITQLQSTYNNLLNNNLNDTMKFLTVWSLLLTIPTIVTGFFGMNLNLPFTELGWGFTLLLSILLSVAMLIALWRYIK